MKEKRARDTIRHAMSQIPAAAVDEHGRAYGLVKLLDELNSDRPITFDGDVVSYVGDSLCG